MGLDPFPPVPQGWTPVDMLQWIWGLFQDLINNQQPAMADELNFTAWALDNWI